VTNCMLVKKPRVARKGHICVKWIVFWSSERLEADRHTVMEHKIYIYNSSQTRVLMEIALMAKSNTAWDQRNVFSEENNNTPFGPTLK